MPQQQVTTPEEAIGPLKPAAPLPPRGSDPNGPLTLAVLHEVLLALAHNLPQEQTIGLLAEKARLLTGCASAAIALTSEDRDSVTFAAVSGEDARELQGTRVRIGDTIAGQTARTGEPYLAYSPVALAGTDGASASGAVHSAAVVPIFEGGVPVGALAALNKNGGAPFAGDDLLSLSTLAAAASVALANHHLRHEGRRQGRELSTLYEAVRNVSGQLSAQEVLLAVVEQVAAHVENSAVAVFLVNDERTHLYIAADRGLSDDQREVTLPADAGIGAACLGATRPVFLTFAPESDDEGFPSPVAPLSPPLFEPPFPGLSIRSALAAPIRSGDVVHGLVLTVAGQPDAYAVADANLLSALAAQAAVAMENAWLYEDATRRAEEAAALYELSQTITSTLRLPDVLEIVADSVLNLLAVDKFALFLRDRSSERLQMVVARGLAEGAPERIQPLVGQGIPGWVVEFETPTAVQDVAADHRNASAPLHPEGVVSMTCMPLQVGASTIGVLCAMSSRRRLFTVAEMELCYTIANQAAIAIDNARIYADVRQKALELRRYFHRVARALGSAQSPEGVPHLIASLTLEVMGADRCALYSVADAEEPGGTPRLKVEAAANFRLTSEAEGTLLRVSEDLPAGWVARRARPLTIPDLAEDPRFAEPVASTVRGRVASYVGVPLRSGREVVGVLEVYTRAQRLFTRDQVRLLITFASQATVALQNARLAEESGRAARNTHLLQRLLQIFASDRGPEPGGPGENRLLGAIAEHFRTGVVWLERDAGPDPRWRLRGSAAADAPTISAAAPALEHAAARGAAAVEDAFQLVLGPAGNGALALLTRDPDALAGESAATLSLALSLLARSGTGVTAETS
jgi:GAF domain-containing protein